MKPYIYTFNVPKEAIDHNGHVHNVAYLQWMIEAATQHSESVGFGYETCFALGGTWVAKSHHIEYRYPAFSEEVLQMKTWVEEARKAMSVRCYEIVRLEDGKVICEGRTQWVFIDSKTYKPVRIPLKILHAFGLERS
jgi:acyl-CoA thioester hydrolase